MSVQAEQHHIMCGLQEAVITEPEDVGKVRMEEHLGGVISLYGNGNISLNHVTDTQLYK